MAEVVLGNSPMSRTMATNDQADKYVVPAASLFRGSLSAFAKGVEAGVYSVLPLPTQVK